MNFIDFIVILVYFYGNIFRIFDCGVVYDFEVYRIIYYVEVDEGDDEDEKL